MNMTWRPKPGERVRVRRFKTFPAFNAVVIKEISIAGGLLVTGYNIRDQDGREWFRKKSEMKPGWVGDPS